MTLLTEETQPAVEEIARRPNLDRPRPLDDRAAAAAWIKNVRVDALWVINEPRNAWVYLSGTGWRKIAATSDAAVLALTVLAASAKESGATVNCLLDDAGAVTEIYVW